jgi:hypothetical protein
MHHRRPYAFEVPDTGSVRDDLLVLLRRLVGVHDSPSGEASHGLMAEIVRSPGLMDAVRTRFIEPVVTSAMGVLPNGEARGEVRPDAITPRIAGVGPTLLRQHVLLYGGPVPDSVPVGIVDEVLMPLVEPRS